MISIIILVYNSGDYLYNCLNSILKQSYQDFEVICLNNNSNDSSSEILEYFTLKDSRIKVINNDSKKDQTFCKNKCLEHVRGKYVTFFSPDEWFYFSTLEILFKYAEDNNLDLVYYNNKSDIDEFKVFSLDDIDKTIINSDNWSKFYLKSALLDEDSIKRISFINKTFKSSQNSDINNKFITERHLKQVYNQIDKVQSSILNQHEQTKKFIDSQKDLNNHLRNSADLVFENYHESRRYFFNNQEDKLKKYFDTNDLFNICYYNNFKFLSYSPEENRILIQTDDGIIVGSNNRLYTIKEVIAFNGYSIPQLYDFDEFVVFDVGMNRAYASLWFAKFENCKNVYGFEIDPETYDKALSNVNLNPSLSCKIRQYNFGLSNENGEVELYYVNGCDGVNTMFSEVADLQGELKDKTKVQTKTVHVKKASEVLSKIIVDENISSKIVLKIDTEGAEYNIIKDLIDSNLISKIDVLLGEGHIFEREHYCGKLKELGFRQVELEINPVTYNFAFVKEDYFDVWPLKE